MFSVKMTKPYENSQLIPAKTLCRDGPALDERTNDTGGVSVEWHDPQEVERVVESDCVTTLCAAAICLASCAVAALPASIEQTPDAPETSATSNSPLHMRDEVGNDGEMSEVVDANDGANCDTRGEREEGMVSTNSAADEEDVRDDEDGN